MNQQTVLTAVAGITCGLVISVACTSKPRAPAPASRPENGRTKPSAKQGGASRREKAPVTSEARKTERTEASKHTKAGEPVRPAARAQGRLPLPEGRNGIAAKYPGDVGIESDPASILVESFEDPVDAICERWETVSGKEMMTKSTDVPLGSGGKESILLSRVPGLKYTGGGQFFRRLKNKRGGYGYDQVFARFYMKFNKEHAGIHHYGTHLGGYNPPQQWPMIRAGDPPPGDLSFHTEVEPGNFGSWHFYTYWQHMRGSPPRGQTWGNTFQRGAPKQPVEKEKWVCVEIMMKVNDVGDSNGEQAFWIDGRLNRKGDMVTSHQGKGFPWGTWTFDKFWPGENKQGVAWSKEHGKGVPIEGGGPFEGFEWRTVPELNINYMWLYRYMSKPETGRSMVWWDHVVVATKYIGPMTPRGGDNDVVPTSPKE